MSYEKQDKEIKNFFKENAGRVPESNIKASDVWQEMDHKKRMPKAAALGSLVTAFALALVIMNTNEVSDEEIQMASFLSESFSASYIAEEDISDDFLAQFSDQ